MSTHVTIVASVNAAGERMSPLLVVKGKTERSVFGFNTREAPSGTMWDFQENGWMDDRIGERWFKEIFLKQCGTDRPQVLILDGHSSHESLALIQEGIRENIAILSLPPHTTHYLQPLDRTVFGLFDKQYDWACSEFLQENTLHKVDKWTFPTLFKTAWHASMTAENIKSGFRACGIIPFSPLAIPEYAYLPSEPTENFNQANSFAVTITELSMQNSSGSSATDTENIAPSGDAAVSSLDQESTWSSIVEVAVDFPAITGDHLRQPEIDDPQHLLQLIMDNKIEVVANDTADGVVALSDTWNAEVNSLFLPCDSTLNIAGKTKTTTDKVISRQSHRLLTSEDVVREKLLLAQKKADKEQKKAEANLKRELIKAKRVAK